jgi:hypothetical protein
MLAPDNEELAKAKTDRFLGKLEIRQRRSNQTEGNPKVIGSRPPELISTWAVHAS